MALDKVCAVEKRSFLTATSCLSSKAMSFESNAGVATLGCSWCGLLLRLLRRYVKKPTIKAASSTPKGTPKPIPTWADVLSLDDVVATAAAEVVFVVEIEPLWEELVPKEDAA